MSRLSWNEIRVNAAKFAEEWKDARYEKGETQSFYNSFFEVFGVSRRKVASFEEPVKKLHNRQGFIDLFWRKTLLVEHKSAGKNLDDAKAQALEYFVGIKDEELPRYLLLCDFQNFHLFDLYRYSIGVVYNNFPLPALDVKSKEMLGKRADAALEARAEFPDSTLADLYDPLVMPDRLRKAHNALDLAVEKLYRAAPFLTDRDRVEFLLAEYEKLTAPLLALAAEGKKKRRTS